MKTQNFGQLNSEISPIILGCMRLTQLKENEASKYIEDAVSLGINSFDHSDIYDGGKCEELFGKALKGTKINRENIFIQTKCGIVPGKMYDLSKKHIIESVNNSLKRLQLDYIDSLLLHRPDALVEPEEVAAAFDELYSQGKVKYFGVSNHNSMQIELLSKFVNQPICFNQMQMSIAHCPMITSGLEVNMATEGAVNRDGSILDYCRLNNIILQAWSPFQQGFIEGPFLTNPKFSVLNNTLKEVGNKYGVSETTIATAWLLRHPSKMKVVAGTMKKSRLGEICKGVKINLEREDWYKIYMAAGNMLP